MIEKNAFSWQIAQRYTGLAEQTCSLSCGGALDRSHPQPGEVCVDLGSGRGQDVLRLAEAVGSAGFAYGIDVSEGMLKKARRTAEKVGVTHVEFIRSELESIALPGSVANLVVSNCTINHAGDKAAVWGEIFRILVPGGRFVVSDIYATEDVPQAYRNDPQSVAECWAGAVVKEEYLSTVREAGFEQLSIVEESAPYDKGEIQVASFTLQGTKPASRCCCGGNSCEEDQ